MNIVRQKIAGNKYSIGLKLSMLRSRSCSPLLLQTVLQSRSAKT